MPSTGIHHTILRLTYVQEKPFANAIRNCILHDRLQYRSQLKLRVLKMVCHVRTTGSHEGEADVFVAIRF